MARPSLNLIISGLFLAYILHSVYTIYTLFTPPVCPENTHCIKPYLQTKQQLMLTLYSSTKRSVNSASDLSLLWQWENVNVNSTYQATVNVSLPLSTRHNGSLYVHAFLIPKFQTKMQAAHMMSSPFSSYTSAPLTVHMISEAQVYNLLSSNTNTKSTGNQFTTTHWKTKLDINIMSELVQIPAKQVPAEIMKYLKLSPQTEYLPILYIDSLNSRIKDAKEIRAEDVQCELNIIYAPISYGKLRFYSQVDAAMQTLTNLGFQEKDLDEVKGVFLDTNLYLLCITFVVAALHVLFDFLAFKNDISFWRKRKTMVGLSTKTLVWRCISQTIIFFYLMDENTSQLILIPGGIGAVIEVWKLTKAFKIELRFQGLLPKFTFGSTTKEEMETEKYDSESMKYLSYIIYPLCVGGAIYSLLYSPHKSWYSWSIQSLANGVYAFGFLFMLPQLFVNYRHKSVAHLPWKAFMYKAFNTFIDDVFAFIVTMPTAHRVACFRDDVVFLIYLYQRWLYPVDKSRINEFGESFSDDNSNKIMNSKKKR
ncbi:hypothetical protein CHUAL_002206 [Chamberlinius hualienensis]